MPNIPGSHQAHCPNCGRYINLQLDPPEAYLEKHSCPACSGQITWHPVEEPPSDDEKPETEYYGDDPHALPNIEEAQDD